MNKLTKVCILTLAAIPSMVFAQGRIILLLTDVKYIIRTLIIIVAAIALLVFFWGLVRFIFKVGGSEEAVKEGRTLMIWGLIALFVMVTVWGLISFIEREIFGTLDKSDPNIPSFRP
ncbi:MAG: hypothetical protein AAB641_00955 [Patescibacteria group bacterium]